MPIKEARGGARGFTLRSYGDGVCGGTPAPLPSIGEQASLLLITVKNTKIYSF